jgi:Kae1-associated kinase Bud32
MKLLRQGAEAKLFKAEFEGKPALLKKRVPKRYRNKQLDERIRSTRTTGEANLLRKARSLGVSTPQVYEVDKGEKEIVMELVDGPRLKDVLDKKNLGLCRQVGEGIAVMHENGLIHGDLTTSNVMVRVQEKEGSGKSGKDLYFIDFGLGKHSKKLEDKAVDLLVFKKTFEATHVELMPRGWELILEGYLAKAGQKEVLAQMKKVEERVRYH